MLAGAGFGDDPLLAHAAGEQDLPHDVVDLVRAGVVQLVALEIDLRSPEMFGEPFRKVERRRPADVMLEEGIELGLERGIGLRVGVGLLQLEDERHERLRHEPAAEQAEAAVLVGA